jgi:hypothetical protein
MPTKSASAKKTTAKKGTKKAAAKVTADPCTQKCVQNYLVCLRRGGNSAINKARCLGQLIECLNDCLS